MAKEPIITNKQTNKQTENWHLSKEEVGGKVKRKSNLSRSIL